MLYIGIRHNYQNNATVNASGFVYCIQYIYIYK